MSRRNEVVPTDFEPLIDLVRSRIDGFLGLWLFGSRPTADASACEAFTANSMALYVAVQEELAVARASTRTKS